MGALGGWRAWALRAVIVLALSGFVVGAYGLNHARHQAVEFRHELCAAENSTRAGVRTMIDLAFQPGISKQNDPVARGALEDFRESLKRPVAPIPCNQIVNP